METLESSRVCRLCGKHSGISINIFDKNESHVRKINAVLPIMVHEMDLLPKHMCHRCSYKLEEFHKFYVDCLKTDADLKGQLSWMRKADAKERIGVPMVHIENVKIKAEPPDYDIYDLDPIVENVNYINSMSSVTFPVNGVRTSDLHDGITYATYARCRCYYDKDDRSKQSVSTDYEGAVPRCETKVNNDDLDARGASGARTNVATNTPPYRVTRSLLAQNAPRDQLMNPLATGLECEVRRYRSTGASGTSGSIGRLAGYEGDKTSSSATVRNLRPRKASVDYVGAKRKARSPGSSVERKHRNATIEVEARSKAAGAAQTELGVIAKVKVEKVDETEGRSLRPRVKTVDYLGTKRRAHVLAAASIATHRLRDEQFSSKRYKFVNATNATRSSAGKIDDGDTKPVIKKEPVDFEESIGDVSRCTPPRPARTRVRTVELDQCRIVTLPKNVLTVENDVSGRSRPSGVRSRKGFSLSDKLKSLTRASKNGLRRRKAGARQAQAVYYSPKCLRSHDVHLRNGKVRKSDDVERSLRRLRRNFGCIGTRNLTIDNGLLRAIKRTDSAEEPPSTVKLNESNIKHYCEKCNLSFASKELFRLHACYD